MNKMTTELVFILDRSGSMSGLEADTIDGFNGMIERQRKGEGNVNVTTVLFDDQVDIIHDRFALEIISPMTEDDYYVRGCTALLDAVGFTVQKIDNIQKRLPEDMKADKVIVVITTDGHENSSRNYSYSQVKRLIEAKKEEGWEFLFLGANIDAGKEAERIGISRKRSVTYENDSKGIELNYAVVSDALMKMSTPVDNDLADDWDQEIKSYHGAREKQRMEQRKRKVE